MKKFFKIVFILFLAITILAGLTVYFFIKNFDINKYKPMILSEAKSVLGHDIDFSSATLNISLSKGLAVKLNNLQIDDSVAYLPNKIIKIKEIDLGIDFLSYLIRKKIYISKIYVKSARICVIRKKDGRLNIEDFTSKDTSAKKAGQNDKYRKQPEQHPQAKTVPLIMVDSFIFKNCSIKYIDLSSSPETNVDISKIDFKAHGFSPSHPSSFQIDAALFSVSQNISCLGTLQLDIAKQEVSFEPLNISLDLSKLSIDKLTSSLPQLKNKPLPSALEGIVRANIKKITLNPNGLTDLKANIDFSNGKIFIENNQKDFYINLDKIDFKITDFSTDDEFTYSLKMAYLNESPNIFSNGFLKIDLPNKEFSLRDTNFSTQISSFSVEKLKKSFPQLKKDDLPDEIEGSVQAVIKKLRLNNKELIALEAEGGITGGKIVMAKKLKSPIEHIEAKWNMNKSDFKFNNLRLEIGSGQITGSAKIKNYLSQPRFNAQLNLNALDFNELLNQNNEEDVKVEGKLNGFLNLTAEGTAKEKILDSLEGTGDLSITNGKLTNINILKIVLDKLTMFPSLPEIIENGLPDKYKEKLSEKDTVLAKADIKANVKNKQIYLAPITVFADNFNFKGKGEADLDKNFVLKGAFYVPQNFSLRFVKRVKELEYILDDENRIFIPLQVHGTGTDLKFIVDIKYLGKKVIRTQGRDELKKLIYKSLKKKTNPQEEQAPSNNQTEPRQGNQAENQPDKPQKKPEEKSIEDVIIDKVLDTFFKLDEY